MQVSPFSLVYMSLTPRWRRHAYGAQVKSTLRAVALVILATVVWPAASGAQTVGPNPVAMAILCTIERGFAHDHPNLDPLGCTPDVAEIPEGRRPCELHAPRVDYFARLAYDASGRLSEAHYAFPSEPRFEPHIVRYTNDSRGILTVHGRRASATVSRSDGVITYTRSSPERLTGETRFESAGSGLRAITHALTGPDYTDSSRWEFVVSGRQRTATRVPGTSRFGQDVATLQWDRNGLPVFFRLVVFRSNGPIVREMRFRWNALGQLVSLTDFGLDNPTEALYACSPQ